MNTRLDTLKSLAETDPYYRGYLAGLNDEHNIGRPDDRSAELAEANRLLQARLDRSLEKMQQATERYAFPVATSPAVYASLDALVSPRDIGRVASSPIEEVRERLNARRTPNAADLGAPPIR